MDILAIASLVVILGILGAWTVPHLVCPWREQVMLRRLAKQIGFRYHGRRTLGIPRSGRAAGTFRGRDCAIETFKQLGVDPYTRVTVSADNRLACSLDVVHSPSSAPSEKVAHRGKPFQIAHSAPDGLARAVLERCDLEGRAPQFPRQVQVSGYHLSLSGHALRLEHHPHWACFGPIERDVVGYHALLETLCEAADAIEAVEAAQRGRTVAQARMT